jgi:hypothetical protein
MPRLVSARRIALFMVLSLVCVPRLYGQRTSRVLEIRSYDLKPGTRERFHARFEREALPLLQRWTIDVVAYGRSLDDSTSYYLMRSYPTREDRQRTEDAFYASDEWRLGPREAILADIASYTTIVIDVDETALRALRAGLVLGLQPRAGLAQQTTTQGDGQHDFDFEIGTWHTRLKRLMRPLTGSTTWVEYEGTTVVRKVWDGRANLVELLVDGPAGHIEALSLRLYNAESHQWSLNFSNSAGGTLSPPTIGGFKNGRGEFFSRETLNGKAILVRFVISDITPTSCRFEQAFSEDGGKTWEINWVATDTRSR